jgi:C4-dicarboxylate transporter, DctQ subunit
MRFAVRLSNLLRKAAGVCLLGMMLLTCADVVSSFFGYPVLGSEELVGLMASVLLAFALPSTHLEKGHIGVDLLYMRFGPKTRVINNGIISLAGTALFGIISWQCYLYAKKLRLVGEVSPTLQFPTYYLIYGISFACLVLTLVIFLEFLKLIKGEENE